MNAVLGRKKPAVTCKNVSVRMPALAEQTDMRTSACCTAWRRDLEGDTPTLVQEILLFIKHEGSLQCSQHPTSEPYPKPFERTPQPRTLLHLPSFTFPRTTIPSHSRSLEYNLISMFSCPRALYKGTKGRGGCITPLIFNLGDT
jgi:hypothetical protein